MESRNRKWNDLPDDLLELIVLRLSIWDYTSFSRVCRSWRHVLLRNMSKPQSSGSWLIAYENDGSHRCYFHDLLNSRHYTYEFPELHSTLCLASRYGWSLMCSGTSKFFFFNFFSRQRIILPKWKSKELSLEILSFFSRKTGGYEIRPLVAGFSDPSSSDCMVAIIHRIDNSRIEISRCIRGEKAWTTCIVNITCQMGKISGALVQKDEIYCFAEDREGNLQTWFFDAFKMSLATISQNLNLNQSKVQKQNHPVEGKKILVFTLKFLDLYEKFVRRIPSLESWSESRSGYDAYKNPWIYVSLCPFVLTHPPVELASFSHSNLSSCLWTYRCVSAPDFSSHYFLRLQEGPKRGSPHLQVFYVEPNLFQA